jgi:DNA modification methylase
MRYLVRLITPKNGICLDPFLGSGSTAIACILENVNYIGIEREEEYYNIAKARIEYWSKNNSMDDKQKSIINKEIVNDKVDNNKLNEFF